MVLARDVYRLTANFPKAESFGLSIQMRRAAVSVPSNIAEGHGRLTDKSFRLFLAQARGSLFELETQLQLAADLSYAAVDEAEHVREGCAEVAHLINGLLRVVAVVESTSR